MNLFELIRRGANIQITFYDCENEQEAKSKLYPFKNQGEIEYKESTNFKWLVIETDNVTYTAFYDDKKNESEEIFRPRGVTSNEMAMKMAGHKLSDFE